MNAELWIEGLGIMSIGVGVVFSFIILTVFAMSIMSKVVMYLNKIFPEAVQQVAAVKKAVIDDSAIAVAIAAALARK
ncbi:OadG family protein [bacterium]|nr:OadG family protein [bacterium]